MPYVKQEVRARLDPAIEALAEALAREAGKTGVLDLGHLNYALTSVVVRLLRKADQRIGYTQVAQVVGVLQTMVLEFYRRVASPYEDAKALENGDVF